MRLVIDPIQCEGHGLCADLLPEMIELDDWGYPMLVADEVPSGLGAAARKAAAACPRIALALRRR